MKRRQFIIGAASTSLLASLAGQSVIAGTGSPGLPATIVYFDERFPESKRHAERMATNGVTMPVRGDVTDVWRPALEAVMSGEVGELAGVTTESFAFCLDVLLQDRAHTEIEIHRLDRDLHAWVIRATPDTRRSFAS